MSSDGALIQATDLCKVFQVGEEQVEVLRNINIRAEAGEAIVVTGPSGSGKSTLLHILGTLEPPTSGTVEIGSQSPFAWPEKKLASFRNRKIGFVFQSHYLLPQYSVLENVLLPSLANPAARTGISDRAMDLLDRVGLSHRINHTPSQLSGGERQRAAIARALINAPRIVLCDEPTGSLDGATAARVSDILFEVHEQEQTLLLVVTHSQELAGRFPRQLRLRDGLCFEA